MPNFPISIFRRAAVAVFVGGLACASPFAAAHADTYGSTHRAQSPQAMAQHVEDRIKTLHDKLRITDAQETEWGAVAQAMRDNEASIDPLIRVRDQNPGGMSAVDDLQSYENITQAHVDGLKKLIPAFEALYNDMPDGQKKLADQAFGSYEGHRPARQHG